MKRILLSIIMSLFYINSFSQPIDVGGGFMTVPQLVQEILFNTGSNPSACVGAISNITWSTGTNFGSVSGIGYFTNSNPNFPLSNGIILSTGSVVNAAGPNNSVQSEGLDTWPGDTQLFNYMRNNGFINGTTNYVNATKLEFDFVPLTDRMSFDFLFASEEYGQWQCGFTDAFAFFLSNVTTGTAPVNLALVPGTNTPQLEIILKHQTALLLIFNILVLIIKVQMQMRQLLILMVKPK
jgi:hypothetical protein